MSDQEAEQEYQKYKLMMSGIIKKEEQFRQAQKSAYKKRQAFDEREIEIDDEDVYRVGGTLLNSDKSESESLSEVEDN